MSFKISDFADMLRINKHELDLELVRQSETMYRIADEMAKANSRRDEAKDSLNVTESELSEDIRNAEPKLAATKIAMRINAEPTRILKAREYYLAKKEADQWQGMYESWKARGFSIRALCDLYLASYYTKDSHDTERSSITERPSRARSARSEAPSARRRVN